jgi:hypothetical protein
MQKKHIDIVILGLDNNQMIKLFKGKNRPINDFKKSTKLLAELETVEGIFRLKEFPTMIATKHLNLTGTMLPRFPPPISLLTAHATNTGKVKGK